MVKFKNFSRPFSVFQVLFKQILFGLFKTILYIQVLFKPVRTLYMLGAICGVSQVTFCLLVTTATIFDHGWELNPGSQGTSSLLLPLNQRIESLMQMSEIDYDP